MAEQLALIRTEEQQPDMAGWAMERRMLWKLTKENGTKSTTVGKALGYDGSYIRQYVSESGRKVSDEFLTKAREYLKSIGLWEDEPAGGETAEYKTTLSQMDFVETEAARRSWFVLNNSMEMKDFGMICGPSGCGKTYAIKQWMQDNPGRAIIITANGRMACKAIIKRIAKALEIRSYGDTDTLIEFVRDELTTHPRLIIIDEADQLKSIAKLELLRTVYDECDGAGSPIGIVLIGNEDLSRFILQAAVDREELSRIHNRFGAYQKLDMPSRQEADQLLEGYNLTPKAKEQLLNIARNKRRGGIRVLRKVMAILLGAVGNGRITEEHVLSEALARSVLSLNA